MAYDPDTLMRRYQRLLDVGSDDQAQADTKPEHTRSLCASCHEDSLDEVGSESEGGCQACCVGMVEMVKQYSERLAPLEARSMSLDDTWTKANKLDRG